MGKIIKEIFLGILYFLLIIGLFSIPYWIIRDDFKATQACKYRIYNQTGREFYARSYKMINSRKVEFINEYGKTVVINGNTTIVEKK
jgi:hypothetical protein